LTKYALLSVSDKSGLTKLADALVKNGYCILATGNTAKELKSNGYDVTEISDFTGSPEIFSGRVKTLHPKVFGGILFRRDNPSDQNEAGQNGISAIDIVCVNLYPFVKTTENPENNLDTIVENIDIGGPSLIRASAKNYKYVSVLTDPIQYDDFINELNSGSISDETRIKLSVAAFSHTAYYDSYIANYFEDRFSLPKSHIRVNQPLSKQLRYGENPHQNAAIFGNFFGYFEVLHGKELSYNNILDLVAAEELIEDLEDNSCVIIKHNNAAGAATSSSIFDAYSKALKCDPASAYGGIVVFNSIVDETLAAKLNEIFLEIICAPGYTEEALQILFKKRDRRILKRLKLINNKETAFRNIPGGVLVQDKDNKTLDLDNLKVVTDKKPAPGELEDLIFAWIVAKHTKSNAIVFVKDKATLGVGAGQMSRVDSAKIAKMKSIEHKLDLTGCVAASDAFFPFADGLLEIIKCGAVSVIQPGGSIRDQEVIDAANKNNISMVYTGLRHFKH
jgi:phosphoribosylaminoimidazolecarboxamide formyltransferase/IMP cyclohydrolase